MLSQSGSNAFILQMEKPVSINSEYLRNTSCPKAAVIMSSILSIHDTLSKCIHVHKF